MAIEPGAEIKSSEVLALLANGWITVSGTWTYRDAQSIQVDGNRLSDFEIGEKIKFTQATDGIKNYTIVSKTFTGAVTYLVLTGGVVDSGDENLPVLNEAITDLARCRGIVPSYWYFCSGGSVDLATVDNGSGGQIAIDVRYFIEGRKVTFSLGLSGYKVTTDQLIKLFLPSEMPPLGGTNNNCYGAGRLNNKTTGAINVGTVTKEGIVCDFEYVNSANITNNDMIDLLVSGFYEF